MLIEVELQTGFTFVAALIEQRYVTESVALHPTALRSSLPTQARGGRNDDPGQRGDRWCGPSIAAGPCSDLSAIRVVVFF